MNPELLLQKLLAAARANAPSTHVPFAFEKRIMAHLPARGLPDLWTAWGVLLWRAVAPCCVVMLIVTLSSLAFAMTRPPHDLGDQLDAVLLAGLDGSEQLP